MDKSFLERRGLWGDKRVSSTGLSGMTWLYKQDDKGALHCTAAVLRGAARSCHRGWHHRRTCSRIPPISCLPRAATRPPARPPLAAQALLR